VVYDGPSSEVNDEVLATIYGSKEKFDEEKRKDEGEQL
jgi:ABC-type phosphate/phosphonate transport system ATPase subunit